MTSVQANQYPRLGGGDIHGLDAVRPRGQLLLDVQSKRHSPPSLIIDQSNNSSSFFFTFSLFVLAMSLRSEVILSTYLIARKPPQNPRTIIENEESAASNVPENVEWNPDVLILCV